MKKSVNPFVDNDDLFDAVENTFGKGFSTDELPSFYFKINVLPNYWFNVRTYHYLTFSF